MDGQAELAAKIQAVFEHHHGRYGYRRVTAALRQAGDVVNHKAVHRRMMQMGLKSRVRARKYQSNRPRCTLGAVAPNELDRKFWADRPNQKWATDVTEFNVGGQKLYLSPAIDLYNGEIVAYQTSRRPVLEMVQTMLGKAFARLNPGDAPMLHSDQGWHYRHADYKRLLVENAVTQSMSRPATCLDNAVIESFFGVLKTEYFYRNDFANIEELERGLDHYIHYYNHDRIKLKLNGLSPVSYRLQTFGS